ncbi:DUF262 domain-containing protein [Maricaulis sp.]|uniref:DUF262 domain-containing protein n=1 Tax=Maricaulis sp. TaxID=1486257 RepID=UPI003A94B74D
MSRRRKLTNNSDETDISSLLSGDSIFSIPYFQRPYKWTPKRLRRLEEDVKNVIDGVVDSHFLGAIIIHGRRSNPSEPTTFEVIDGQQRITTIFLYISGCVRALCKMREYDEAVALFQKYIAIGRKVGLISNLKLHPCKEDRHQMNLVIDELLGDASFRERLGSYEPSKLPNSGGDTGKILSNFRAGVRFFEAQFEQGGIERVRSVYGALLERMSVVQIDVWDPTDGPRIFDSLNSRQEPMTVGDLVRNEIFSRVSNLSPDEIERIDQEVWQPFYKKFIINNKNLFDGYFFPYGLIKNSNVSKSEVFNELRESWSKADDPAKIIEGLSVYQNSFIDLVCGTNYEGHSKKVSRKFANLYELKAPGSAYPFFMRLSLAIREGEVDEAAAIEILERVESFLVRRSVCGIEPTGLHAVFKKLWGDMGAVKSGDAVEAAIRDHKTVLWPDGLRFTDAIRTRKLYKTGIARYLIQQYNLSLGGDVPQEIPWVEHVLPQSMSPSWRTDFSDSDHAKWADTLANLLPLSEAMNRELSNGAYSLKRAALRTDSMFKSAREFGEKYETWTPSCLVKRSDELAFWAANRWAH